MERQPLQKIPATPGVYFFENSKKQPIYIGKAANLKNRLKSYFGGKSDSRIRSMVNEASSLRWEILDSDIEALIQESAYIKHFKPKYNVMLKDDKQYFSIVINHSLPFLELTHQPQPAQHSIGPFTNGVVIKNVLKIIRKSFPFCTCTKEHSRPCLNADLGKCLGICCIKEDQHARYFTPEENKKRVIENIKNQKIIIAILSGKKKNLLKDIEKKMKLAAQKMKFEQALIMRDNLEKITRLFINTNAIQSIEAKNQEKAIESIKTLLQEQNLPTRIEGYDISHIQGTLATGSMVVFQDGISCKKDYRKFKIRITQTNNELAMLAEVVRRRMNHEEWPLPDLLVIDGGKGQLKAVEQVLGSITKDLPIITVTKNDKHRGDHLFSNRFDGPISLESIAPEAKNLLLSIDAEAHRFAIDYYRKLHGKFVKK